MSAPLRVVTVTYSPGDSLADFAFALVSGIVAGTMSTVSVAVPLTVALDRRWAPPPPVSSTRDSTRARREDGAVV